MNDMPRPSSVPTKPIPSLPVKTGFPSLEKQEVRPLLVIKAPPIVKINHTPSVSVREYTAVSAISSADVLNNDYQTTYQKYESIVIQTKHWLQDTITNQGLAIQLGEARKFRNSAQFKQMREKVYSLLQSYFSKQKLDQGDVNIIIALVANEILGMGPIEPLWVDPNISEIMVNGPSSIYVEVHGKVFPVRGVRFRNREHLLEMIQQMLVPLNKTLDQSHPLVDGRLPDGSRLNATHVSITPTGPSLTIRRFSDELFSLRRFVEIGTMPQEIALELGNLLRAGCNTLFSGSTSSGKTSLLNALAGIIPIEERIITIEDTLEIKLRANRHVLSHEARPARSDDGKDEVTIRTLVRNAMRERPDRIIIGEIRDESALDFVNALSTGHDGSMGTIHANSSLATISRLSNLIMQADEMEYTQALTATSFAIDIIVNIRKYPDGSRRISEVAEVPSHITVTDDTPSLIPRIIWKFVEKGMNESRQIIGEYHKLADWSDELLESKNVGTRGLLTLEQIYELSDDF